RAAAQQGRVHLDAQKVASCIELLKAQSTTCVTVTAPNGQSISDFCATAFVGQTKIGEVCESGSECEPGSRCGTSADFGVCVPYQNEGDLCNGYDDCDPTVPQLYCAPFDFRCHVRAKPGEFCQPIGDAVGQPTVGIDCDTSTGPAYCDLSSGTCV